VIAIVVSRADSASEHIGEQLLAVGDWERRTDPTRPDAAGGGTYYRTDGFELREFDDLHIELSDPAAAFGASEDAGDDEPAFLVFVSRHSGETGALLTAHVTGNFGPAPYGGAPETLARAAPGAEKRVVESLAAHAPEGYDVGIECTHHGPTDTAVPSLFVELGSDEPQWSDPDAARAVARAVLDLRGTGAELRGEGDRRPRHVVGFGGGHYAPRFTRIVRETDWAVGHVAADWSLGDLGAPDANRDVIEQAFSRSRADLAVIEGEKPALAATIRDLGHRVVSETWVREVGDRPLPLVDRLAADLATVEEGLRFGDVVPAAPDAIRLGDLPAALCSRAQGIDADAARAAVESATVAFETAQAGTRATGRAAFAAADSSPGPADLVAGLAAVLEEGYDAVEVTDEAVIAHETAFDPGLAATLGVPEGPAFGRLADGKSVEVDGETIAPETVSRERTDRFPIGPASTPD